MSVTVPPQGWGVWLSGAGVHGSLIGEGSVVRLSISREIEAERCRVCA